MNIDLIWNQVLRYRQFTRESGYFQQKRAAQRASWMDDAIRTLLYEQAQSNAATIRQQVLSGKLNPMRAAQQIVKAQ